MTISGKDSLGVGAMLDITVGLNIREECILTLLLLHSREEPALLAQQASMTNPQRQKLSGTDIRCVITNQLKSQLVLIVPRALVLLMQV